jgi:hypothetical protein
MPAYQGNRTQMPLVRQTHLVPLPLIVRMDVGCSIPVKTRFEYGPGCSAFARCVEYLFVSTRQPGLACESIMRYRAIDTSQTA